MYGDQFHSTLPLHVAYQSADEADCMLMDDYFLKQAHCGLLH